MNALYCCCITDPFLPVAQRLQNEKEIKPVYWIGDIQSAVTSDKSVSKTSVLTTFPNIVFHDYFEAWKGRFPLEIEENSNSSYFDLDFLKKFSSEELQAISMMDRIDYDRHSFIYMERERYYLDLIKKWICCIDLYHIDVVISAVNPHRVFDYVLYLVCRYKNIKFISFQYSISDGRIYPLNYFSETDSLSKMLDDTYNYYLDKSIELSDLPIDIKNNYTKLLLNYNEARPKYMYEHDKDDVKNRNFIFLFKRFMAAHKLIGKHNMFKEGQTHTIYKNSKYSLEQSRFSVWEWYKKRKDTFKYNDFLYGYYTERVSDISLDVPYVIFFLHYQPEATTAPNGDIFSNQYLCIETLLKNTPESVYVYVKEHPNQFMSHMQGHTKRIKEFYDDLIKNPRVRLVPFEKDSFSLMSNALAVSTVTGTVGWEAAVRGKPVIIFGLIWYERMKGILRVTDDKSASQIYSFIKHYQYDEKNILTYLYAFAQKSIKAYHYRGYKSVSGVSQEESVNNIYNSLIPLLIEAV